jgi:two-component system, cell cycle sensor histidine kinase and response regulator CckA
MSSGTRARNQRREQSPVDRSAELLLLILEESAGAEPMIRALREAGVRFTPKLVDTEAAFVRELDNFAPDLVLADATLPAYSGRHALEFAHRTHPEIPVIMISDRGAAEETSAFVRAGARDCIFKDELTGLVPALLAAVQWGDERRAVGQQSEELLRLSEIRYRRLFESAKDGILILDADTGRILDSNPFMTELLGYSRDEYLGKHLWQIGAFADLIASLDAFKKLRQNRYIRYDNLPLRAKDGRMVDVEFVSNVYPEGGRDTIQCNIRNITERVANEKKLVQAQKMAAVGILTGGIAHNINNLLSVVIANIDLLRERMAQDSEAAEYAREAIAAALRGAELIRHMLAFARQQPLRPQRIDINDLVANVARTLRGLLGEAVEVSLHLADDEMLWPVLSDAAQLEATIMNLAVNAREAMPHGGRLSISTANRRLGADVDLVDHLAAPGDYVEIAVGDTGVGMSAEVMQHIFEPFFSTKGRADTPGTGLGLSSAFGFIKQSGGHIGVDSQEAVGTTFRLFLPRLQEAVLLPEAPAPRNSADGRETVLVVEDNAPVRRVVVRQLELLGYDVLQCEDADAALTLLDEKRIDLLFTDILIPGEIDGLKLARTALARWPSLRILLTTGFGDTASRSDARGLRVLEKPYRSADLTRALREALDADGPPTL